MPLDHKLRGQLKRLADQERSALDDRARARIRAAVHARSQRTALWRSPWFWLPSFAGVALAAWFAAPGSTTLREEPPPPRGPRAPAAQAHQAPPVDAGVEPHPEPPVPAKTKGRAPVTTLNLRPDASEPPAVPAPLDDAGAERIWQQGALPYQPEAPEVPSSLQPDGRPMKKPQIVPKHEESP